MKTVIVGGTGLVGSRLVAALRERGVDAVVVARETGADVLTGEGLAPALDGADVVIDVVNVVTMDADEATRFFETAARNVADAERSGGVPHHVLLSIVGLERAPENGYYVGKLAQEAAVKNSGVPFTILRSTQFYEYISTIADWATEDATVKLPQTLLQPIAVDDMVSRLADLSQGSPLNGTVEIAGPEAAPVPDLVRQVLAAKSDPRSVVALDEGQLMGAADHDSLVPYGDHTHGQTTLSAWLEGDTRG